MRQSWTDDRLDDLSSLMNERFDHVEAEMDQRFGRVESEMRGLRTEMIDNNRERAAEFIALQRTIIHAGVAMFAGIMGVIAAIVGVVITQL
ncbi:MAG TPA: hypothetical protein VLK89_04070 [Solirubrobacterales bacterium]|nr:hypothetical protein [Solirubrobacterales bacterium]